MKSKKALFILLPAVLFVWIMLFVRIFGSFKDEPVTVIIKDPELTASTNKVFPDSFVINANYRDPFMTAKPIAKHIGVKQPGGPAGIQTKKTNVVTAIIWPQVKYMGTIKNQQSKKQVAMVQVNGRSQMLAPGATTQGLELKRVFKDSIEVVYQKQKKTIKKG